MLRAESSSPTFLLAELASRTGATLDGDGRCRIMRVGTLENAGEGAIAFLANPKYRAQLLSTRASAVIVSPTDASATTLPKLVATNPYATYAKVAALLYPLNAVAAGVHATAVIDGTAKIAQDAVIGAHAVIGVRAVIGSHAVVGPGCVVCEDVEIGDAVVMHANVVVHARCLIGARTVLYSGVIIGADGFGLAEEGGKWLRIPQVGRVIIGADCEIGANTTIDRGAIDDTVIEDDVRLDNQIQVGHNCFIGRHTAIAGCVGIAGSTHIGRNCQIGGAAMISGHLTIPDGTVVSAGTLIWFSPREPGRYTGVFPQLSHREWMAAASKLRKLGELAERIRALERALQEMHKP
ncbi:MAG TPA: UDP-3-O-(3-hydroxymyristoyl)glucosamine N-acyltransferase [Casimicrobiaceae bacterium]|nr:UDP-3-O-(3-hydroxymyristoyl)glucosamine N-acyltransferase [Casimicrobiaceae bacterium]